MFSAGEVRFKFPEIQQTQVPIDLDSAPGFFPNLSTYPVDNIGCNDFVLIQSEPSKNVPNERRLRFQFFGDMDGLWGVKTAGGKGDRSHYSIVLEADGVVFAQKVVDGAKKIYETEEYDFSGFVGPKNTALVNILSESLAGLAIQSALQNGTTNPLYRLASHLDRHREESGKSIPTELIQSAVNDLNNKPVQPLVGTIDMDESENFVGAGSVAVALSTSNDRVFVRTVPGREEIVIHFASEVKTPEAGSGVTKYDGPDDLAPREIHLSADGIRVLEVGKGETPVQPVIAKSRLAGMSAIALVTLGAESENLELAKAVLEKSGAIQSRGHQTLPKIAEIERTEAEADYFNAAYSTFPN